MKKVSIVIGLYNSAKTIESVLEEIDQVFSKLPEFEYEAILVDDRGPDNVFDVVKKCAAADKRIKVVRLAKNSGQTNAVMEGYRYVTGDYVVEMDDDFQMPAYEIPNMIQLIEEGDYDVVFAKYKEQKESAFRLLGSKINNKMTQIMLGKPKDLRINSFFVMRRFICDEITKYANHFPYVYGIIFSLTTNVANLEMEHRPRTNGTSNYNLRKLLGLWLNGFLNYSVKPLRLAVFIGVLITIISFVIAIILIIQKIMMPASSVGWTSIMVSIIFFSGILLLGIGILGEYIGRLFISSSGLSRVVVKETINISEQEQNGDNK